MSAFDLAELRRLSETNKPGPWGHSQSGYVFTGGGDAVCRTDVRDTDEDAGPLIAYLGTHRDRIVALLRAADEMEDALLDAVADCTENQPTYSAAIKAYRAAKGEE